ncbi:MAG TPA: hypothetical protein VGL11_11705 [Candidatus Binatia bacterium]
MTSFSATSDTAQPEKIVAGVRRRLATHALWQAALFSLPPLLAVYYTLFFLHRFAWLNSATALVDGVLLTAAAGALAVARSRSLAPSNRFVARLIDDKAAGEDRFVTLTTLDPAVSSPALFSRLQLEAASLEPRIEFGRDFPFRVPRSFLNSCIGALSAIVLFHLVLEALPYLRPTAPGEQLALMSRKLAAEPRFAELARDIEVAAGKLENKNLSENDRREILQELERRIAAERSAAGSSPLNQIADLVQKELKKREDSPGITLPFKIPSLFSIPFPWLKQPGEEEQDGKGNQGAGGSQQRAAGEGQGEGKKRAAARAQGEQQSGEKVPTPAPDAQNRLSSGPSALNGEKLEPGGEEERRKIAERKGSGPGQIPKERMESSSAKGGSGEGSEEQTAQRLSHPGGNGPAASKEPRFVVVELPEDDTAPATGGATRERGRSGAKTPVGNLPLGQPDSLNAASEQQRLPLEYRGVIQ